MHAFVGRKNELAVLEQAYESKEGAFIPIYGRRRVGKSELILHFLRPRNAVYFVGKRAPAPIQMREFLQEAALALGEPLLATFPTESWRDVLTAVSERRSVSRKLVLALDEFQWIAETSPELPSVLQELWDRKWRRAGGIMLILCGSYVGFMERAVLGRESPLFGRRTAQIHLGPFGFREAGEFHPAYSLVDRARTFFVCGGVPLYLHLFASNRSVEANIRETILSPYGPLHSEPDFLLREELRELENYYAILMTVASGVTQHGEISARTGLDSRALQYYLKQLCDLGYLARHYPLTGAPAPNRHVRYMLEDPLLRFWFRFVFPCTSRIVQAGPARAFREIVQPQIDSYFGSCFERLCREALPGLYERDGVQANYEIGEYWDRDVQIDVVGLRGDNWTDLGECKWGKVHSPKQLETDLAAKAARYPNGRDATLGLHVFTRLNAGTRTPAAAAHGDSRIRWHTLEELYASN